jgi:hypothetical protein
MGALLIVFLIYDATTLENHHYLEFTRYGQCLVTGDIN